MELTSETDAQRLASLLMTLTGALNIQSAGGVLSLLREADLSLPRLVALNYLGKSGPATISQISEHLNLALGTTSHVVDQLVHGGYVERRESEHDRRHKEVSLTAAGLAVLDRFRRLRADEVALRLGSLPPDLRARLGAVIEEALAQLGMSA